MSEQASMTESHPIGTGERLKMGTVFYYAAARRAGANETGLNRVVFSAYTLRSVRKGIAFLIEKNDFTWVKKDVGKNAEWGWASTINYCWRRSFVVGERSAAGLAPSQAGAVRLALQRLRRARKYWEGKCEASVADVDAELACLIRWQERFASTTKAAALSTLRKDEAE